jgi:hypothetical protein
LALAFQAAQARRTRLTANEVQRLWAQLDRADLSGSWNASVGPRIVRAITAGQLSSANAADDYVDEVVGAEGADSDRVGRVRPEAFAGIAADGRSLDSLMLLSVITTKQGIAGGLSTDDAMMRGLQQALRLSSSEVTQAGRSAVGSSMVGQRTIQGYVRVVNPPACSRCIILAGKEYGWNKGFQRHPRCDCVHLPTTLVARRQHRGFIDPNDYFNSLSASEQNRVFGLAGARAIREGADMAQVVNVRRRGAMYTTTAYGRTVQATREGATRRGAFYRQERRRAIDRGLVPSGGRGFQLRTPRLLPEEIFRVADSRDEAIAMLRRFGYLT